MSIENRGCFLLKMGGGAMTRVMTAIAGAGALCASAIATAQPSPPATAEQAEFNLVCLGAGSANRASSSSVYVQNNNGGSAWGNAVGNRSVPFDDQVNVNIQGDESRIRMPRAMLPPIRGGEGGWFKLKALKISENEITGSVAVNAINNPKLRIDRLTGAISVSGKAGDYAGRCEPYDPATMQRAF